MSTTHPQRQYNVHDAKTNFSRILQLVETGEEVIISRAGEPVAKVVPLRAQRTARGSLQEPVVFHADFDDLSDDEGFSEAFGLRHEEPA
ncbi:type II toxin-antitoxin system prevent-host-death family antitoxin [Streptomyces sp. MUM 203J]|uniref:type II toxin-antitoxin system Phd/YefM family antitoxin n=1 Tax=Streptomyces sp. MUM 203J TaxID=2791990 RepID=UPI001F03E3BF|nr:type II toxin-antitoxin system prevent-host-death family antitoxin [Streptomyces sp. MUM 203J]MCH0538326.1 type II toxin-antitoxin system prevent-host-death family antitoxin [Streptomyces sp. MUM 203J]